MNLTVWFDVERASRGLEQGLLYGMRDLDRNEPRGGVEVIFSALVNNAHISITLCLLVRHNAVNLVQFERSRVFGIVDAHDKSRSVRRGLFSHGLVQITLSFEFLPPDTVGLVPMKFGDPHTAIGQPNASDSLNLAPSPLTIDPAKSSKFADSAPTRNRLGIRNLAQNLEVHRQSLCHVTGDDSR